MRPTADQRDHDILTNRRDAYNTIAGARVGDWIIMLDGTTRRFTHDWGDGLQTTCGNGDAGSFYLGEDRTFGSGMFMSYSGSLDHLIPRTRIAETNETRDGRVWFFHHDHHTADNAVEFSIPFRVFRELEAATETKAHCEGCDSERHDVERYKVTRPSGAIEDARYCGDCAELARMNWNGNTAAIEPAANDRDTDRCPGRDHRDHVPDVCDGTCCTTCGGPIDENEECRC